MTLEVTLRLFVALLLGGIVGIEREFRSKDAGFRTHFLVALGSALFCVVSQYGFGIDLKDSSRVAAQDCLGNRIPRRWNHHLSEKYGTRTYDSSRTVGNGGYRTGLRYGNVCCGRDRYGDDTAGTGGAQRLDPTGGNDDREPDFLGYVERERQKSGRSDQGPTVSSCIPTN